MKKFFTSFRGKLISTSFLPIIGFTIFMMVSFSVTEKLGQKLEVDHTTLIPNLIAYGDVLAQRFGVGYFALQTTENRENPKARKESIDKLKNAFKAYKSSFQASIDAPDLPEESEILKKVRDHHEEFVILNEDFISKLEANSAEDDKNIVKEITVGKWNALAKEVRLDVTKVIELYKTRSQEMKIEQEKLREQTKMKLWIFFFIINFLNIGILILIAHTMSKKMQSAIDVLSQGADKVTVTSEDTAKTSTELSASVTETAAALQETTSSVEETTQMISRNADNAKASMTVAQNSKEAVEKGLDAVEEMTKSIEAIFKSNNQILDQVETSNKEMQEIVNVITEIGNKTKLINDIVFQTKLLSFNASVEAARAGENGKGFAVVAEEVGNLAKMSGDSANEISSMLESSLEKVKRIAESTRAKVDVLIVEGKEKVDQGVKVAAVCSDALNEINVNVEKVNDLVHEISKASDEQAQGMIEINKAMLELDNTSSLNNQITQRVSHSAEELRTEVDSIRKVVKDLANTLYGQE